MLQILQLEDDPLDAQLTVRLLREAGLEVEVERVHTFVEFQRSLLRKAPSLILADYTVPGVDVFKALEWAQQTQPDVPFIFLSGTLGEDVAIETLKMGATDYVLKQRIGRLVPAVRRARDRPVSLDPGEQSSRCLSVPQHRRFAVGGLVIDVRKRHGCKGHRARPDVAELVGQSSDIESPIDRDR